MFLTRMALDINRPETQELLADPEKLRLTVRLAFAGGSLVPLFRLDEIGSRTWLVVLSALRPDMHAAHTMYGYPGVFPSWETFYYDDTFEDMEPGSVWHFELTASPIGLTDRVQPAWEEADRLRGWLAGQGAHNGFALRSADIVHFGWVPIGEKHLLLVRFQGVLTVQDAEQLRWSVSTGIGGGRDWGAGLMTIARAHTIWEG